MRKLVGLFACATILVAACGGTNATQAPASVAAPSTPAASAGAPSAEAPSASGAAGEINLFGSAYAPAEPTAQGGSVIIGDWQEATQFNPYYFGQVTEGNVVSAVWHTLLAIDDNFKYIPQLAAEPIPTTENGGVKVPGDNGDAMTVTWKLRDGLKWSDGQPLTCDDFKYAWEWVMDKDNTGVVLAGFEDTTGIDCPTDTDIVMHYDKVFEGYLSQYIAPMPRHYMKDIPVADMVNGAGFRPDEIAKMPVSGPFKYESVTPQAELRLAKNEFYQNPRTGKPASLDELVFKWYGDPDAEIAGYRNNEIDVAYDLQDSDLPKVQDLGDQVSAIQALLYEYLRPNWSPGPFTTDGPNKNTGGCSRNPAVQDRGTGCPTADPAIRQAIAYAIDKNEINTRLLGGNAAVANTNTSPSAWFYKDAARTTSTRTRPSRSSPTAAGPTPTATASSRRTASRPRSSCARRPGRSARTRWPSSAHGSRTSASTASSTRCRRRTSSPTTTSRRTTPRATSRGATSTSPNTRHSPRSTRSATTPASTAASSARRARTMRRSAIRTLTSRSMT